jgi:hypothetical protein
VYDATPAMVVEKSSCRMDDTTDGGTSASGKLEKVVEAGGKRGRGKRCQGRRGKDVQEEGNAGNIGGMAVVQCGHQGGPTVRDGVPFPSWLL